MIERTQDEIISTWKTKDLEHPLVSVRCLTYNHEPYIAQALDGFLMQVTDFPFEVIVHDDASTDKTAEIIKEYEAKYPKIIKAIYETENQYSKHDGSLRRIMDAACKGKYIAMCEGDDYWIDPLKLQKQVDFLDNNPEYSMCYCRFKTLNQATGEIQNDGNERYFVNGNDVPFNFEKFCYTGWHIGTQTIMYKQSVFFAYKDLIKKCKYYRDIHLVTLLLKEGKGICLNFFAAIYRKHSGGIYSGISIFTNAKNSFNCYREIYLKLVSTTELRDKYIFFSIRYILELLKKKKISKMLKVILLTSYDIKPFSKKFHFLYKTLSLIIKKIFWKFIKPIKILKREYKYYLRFVFLFLSSCLSVKKGVTDKKFFKNDIIVSLTTYNKRINTVFLTIESILRQTYKPNKIVLWLSEAEFKNKNLPKLLLTQKKRGLEIKFCTDIRSYTKLIPAIKEYPNASIITLDDDILYEKHLIEGLINEHKKNASAIICARAHKMMFNPQNSLLPYNNWEHETNSIDNYVSLFATGVGGVLYPASSLHKEVTNEEMFLSICPSADDVWFKAMSLLQNTKIINVPLYKNYWKSNFIIKNSQDIGLFNENVTNNKNDEQIKNVFEKYNLYKYFR